LKENFGSTLWSIEVSAMSPLCRHKVDIWLVENWIPLMDCDHLQTQYLSNATGLYNNPQW
jgi:hypothetical protein